MILRKFALFMYRNSLPIIIIIISIFIVSAITGYFLSNSIILQIGIGGMATVVAGLIISIIAAYIVNYAQITEKELYEGRKYICKEIKLLFKIKSGNNNYWNLEVVETCKVLKILQEGISYLTFYLDIPKGNIDFCNAELYIDGNSKTVSEKRLTDTAKMYTLNVADPMHNIKEIKIVRRYPSKAEIWGHSEEIEYRYTIIYPTLSMIVEIETEPPQALLDKSNVAINVDCFDGRPLHSNITFSRMRPNALRYIILREQEQPTRFFIGDRIIIKIKNISKP